MEFLKNIPGNCADGGIARHLPELVPAHSVGYDIEAKRQVARVPCHGGCQRKEAVFVQFPLLAYGLATAGRQLLKVITRLIIVKDRLDLLL